jgi:hypothetical protein
MRAEHAQQATERPRPWHKGRLVGPKPPFRLKEIWTIRIRLQIAERIRDLALSVSPSIASCAVVVSCTSGSGMWRRSPPRPSDRRSAQDRPASPVRADGADPRRMGAGIAAAGLRSDQFLFPSRHCKSPHLSTRQYSRVVKAWATLIGLNPEDYGTHSLRRTKATLIYRRTKNLRAVQTAPGSHQAGEHRSLPRHRSRRCAGDD